MYVFYERVSLNPEIPHGPFDGYQVSVYDEFGIYILVLLSENNCL